MRLFYTLLVFGLSLQFSAYLLQVFEICPSGSIPLGVGPDAIAATFSIEVVALLISGNTAITIVALLLRQGTYALYAMLIWSLGVMLPIVRDFFLAIPNFITAMPIPSTVSTPLALVVGAVFAFAGFMFFIELTTQRNVT